jgi:hypothetical protein
MPSKTIALLTRALRVDARLLRTHLFRAGLVGMVIFFLYQAQTDHWSGAPGLEFFGWLQYCNFWFITFAGATFFATSITEEKEELTLSLLKLAGIRPLALLLGKWAPRTFGAVLLLSVQFPFTLLAITLGGILWDQALAAYLALAAHLLLVGSIGLLASVVCSRSAGACTLTTIIIVALSLIAPLIALCGELCDELGLTTTAESMQAAAESTWRMDAFTRLGEILQTGFSDPPLGVQFVSNVAAAVLLFGLSWGLFDFCTRNESSDAGARWWTRLIRIGRRGSRRAWETPCVWKDFYLVSGGPRWVLLRLPGYALLLMLLVAIFVVGDNWSMDLEDFGGMRMATMLIVLLVEAALIAARVFRYESLGQTWSGLVLLPRSQFEVSMGKVAGSALGLLPAAGWFLCGALVAPSLVADFLEELFSEPEFFLAMVYLLTQVALFLELVALLSISWSWAAWPLSIFFGGLIVFMGNAMLIACLEGAMIRGPDEVIFFFLCCFGAGLAGTMFVCVATRLRTLAAA